MMRRIVAWAVLAVAGSVCLGKESPPASAPSSAPATEAASRPKLSRQEAMAKLSALQREAGAAFEEKDYVLAEKKCREFLAMYPSGNMEYNLACALALQGKADDAFAALAKAAELGHGDADHAAKDEDLESLRKDKRWDGALKALKENGSGAGPYEKGADITGVKTVEENPEGGLRFRVRMSPAATAEKPNRLIVWLHPSGGSMNRVVEAMSPELIKHNYALLVLSQKQFMGWAEDEGEKLVSKTIPAAAKIPGIDASRPILMGFSAGGQMALELWDAKPAAWGGLVLDAAYPVTMKNGRYILRELPKDRDAAKKTPIFAIVGEKDGGLPVWKKAKPDWLSAGVPVQFHSVPNQGHAWLFGKDQTKLLLSWLDDVAAGKLPADPLPPASTEPASGPATRRHEADL